MYKISVHESIQPFFIDACTSYDVARRRLMTAWESC